MNVWELTDKKIEDSEWRVTNQKTTIPVLKLIIKTRELTYKKKKTEENEFDSRSNTMQLTELLLGKTWVTVNLSKDNTSQHQS